MKNVLFFMILCLMVQGCKTSDVDPNEWYHGRWQATTYNLTYEFNGQTYMYFQEPFEETLTLNKDGSFDVDGYGGTYQVSGNIITFTFDDGNAEWSITETGNVLTLDRNTQQYKKADSDPRVTYYHGTYNYKKL